MITQPLQRLNLDRDVALDEAVDRLSRAHRLCPDRRNFLRSSLTLGSLSMLSGCVLDDGASITTALEKVSRLNDRAQGWLFDANRLAPIYPESMITRPFPYNAYYSEGEVRQVDANSVRLEVAGMVAEKRKWTLRLLGRPGLQLIRRQLSFLLPSGPATKVWRSTR